MLVRKINVDGQSKVSNVLVTRACHSLLLRFVSKELSDEPAKPFYVNNPSVLRVDLQNNSDGLVRSIIPAVEIAKLAEYATRSEGFSYGEKAPIEGYQVSLLYPVVLTPSGNLDLSSEKYLELEISEIPSDIEFIEVYAFESGDVSAFRVRYEKMNVGLGISRENFIISNTDCIILPTSGFDEIQMTYPGGVVVRRTLEELKYRTAISNDLCVAIMDGYGYPDYSVYGFQSCLIVDMANCEKIEVIRDSEGFSAQLFDFVKVTVESDELLTSTVQKMSVNSSGTSVNLDGTLVLRGAEKVSNLKLLTSSTLASVSSNTILGSLFSSNKANLKY